MIVVTCPKCGTQDEYPEGTATPCSNRCGEIINVYGSGVIPFSLCMWRARHLRIAIEEGRTTHALESVRELLRNLRGMRDAPEILRTEDPGDLARAIVDHAESGNPFGMLIETMELERVLIQRRER